MAHPLLSQTIEAFLRQMVSDGCSAVSIDGYRRQLRSLARALGDMPVRTISSDDLNRYLASPGVQLKARGLPILTQSAPPGACRTGMRSGFGRRASAGPSPSTHCGILSVPSCTGARRISPSWAGPSATAT